MGRRRKRAIRTVKRTLPSVFSCPRCGNISVRVSNDKDHTNIICGNCSLSKTYEIAHNKEPVDVYNDFVDWFMKSGVIA